MRRSGAIGLVLVLAGCAAPVQGPSWWQSLVQAESPARYRFDWIISGDAELAPQQVFDDGRRLWLQYPTHQAVPAVFARDGQGDRLLHPRRQGNFLVIAEVPQALSLHGGHLSAEIRRATSAFPDKVATSASDSAPAGLVLSDASAHPTALADPATPVVLPEARAVAAAPTPRPISPPKPVSERPPVSAHPSTPASRPVSARLAEPEPLAVTPSRAFAVTPADGNIRRALARWAREAGWVFEPEHWAVDVDIPLAGSATLGDAFVPAVRELLAATELGDRPLQPCFYANQVLRVVPLAQRCDRTQVPGAA